MSSSDFVFEEGEEIDVGSHGDHEFVFNEGEPVPDRGVSEIVFEEGVGIGGGLVIDDFERNDLGPYSGQLGRFQTVSASLEGSYACANTQTDQNDNPSGGRIYSLEGDGLPNYFELGDTLRMEVVWDDASHDFEINWAHASGAPFDNHYWAELDPVQDKSFRLGGRDDGSNFDTYATTSWDGSGYTGEVLTWELDWADDGTVTSTLLDQDGNTVAGPISGKDGRYDGNVSIGYDFNVQNEPDSNLPGGSLRWDYVRKVA